MPKETSNINTLRDSLTGKELLDILRNAVETEIDVGSSSVIKIAFDILSGQSAQI